MEDNQPAVRINGNLMGNYINAKAVLMAFIQKMEPDCRKASLKTTDGCFVQIVFTEPVGDLLEPGTLIEAFGTVLSRTSFQCKQFVHFSPETAAKFDCNVYNQFIQCYLNHIKRINPDRLDEVNEPVLKHLQNDFKIDWTLNSGGAGNQTMGDTSFDRS